MIITDKLEKNIFLFIQFTEDRSVLQEIANNLNTEIPTINFNQHQVINKLTYIKSIQSHHIYI